MQSGNRARGLINRCFNIESYIIIIQEANMNSGVSQYKNCWKWEHMTFLCRIQGSKCIKCNGPHKTEHHHYFVWCCKANPNTNPPRLETKQDELYSYSFRCLNCKGEHQPDSNQCYF